jgi:hypothetical protein
MRTVGIIATALAGAATVAVGGTIVLSIHDVRRYLNMRKM